MIEKMTKYSFVLMSSESDEFLSSLQKIGLIDITRSHKPVDDKSMELFSKAGDLKRKIDRIAKDDFTRDDEYNSLQGRLSLANKEYAERLPWGDFSVDKVKELENQGCRLHFYNISAKKFNREWIAEYPLEILEETGSSVRFVVASFGSEFNFPVQECQAPESSLEVVRKDIAELEGALKAKTEELLAEKKQIPSLEAELRDCTCTLQHYLAKEAGIPAAENVIDTYIGFAPSEQDSEVKKALDELGVFYLDEKATKEDNPPIKLKNNWFARNFETLTGMYGMPVYDEFDPTPVLAPFFLLFWAFCMGDIGYGLILTAVGYLVRKVDILGLKPHWRLVVTLGVGTTIIGIFLGTFFGIGLADVQWIPEGIRRCMLAGKIEFGGTAYDVSMIAAIAIGIFHICLAMVIKAVLLTKRFGFGAAVSTWGWTLLIVGGLLVAGLALTSVISSSVTRIAVIIIGIVAFLGIYIFNTPGRNPLTNFGAGLWDTYQMATGILGDVLSYIRLYALGLAGGMLGGAFNDLGGMVLGSNPTWQWLPYVLILVFGHTLNFAMACLGAFVHPLRLTFVEYFKNSGYEGKGIKYEPLKQ